MAYDKDKTNKDLRSKYVDSFIRGFALRNYRFKDVLRTQPFGSGSIEFFREEPKDLTAGRNRDIKDIPRGAAFPQAVVKWEMLEVYIKKFGLEESLAWEDIDDSKIDVDNRTLIRIGRGVVKAVDGAIRDKIVTDGGIQTFGATAGWDDQASRQIIDDLERAEQQIAEFDYDTSNLWVYITPKAKRYVIDFLLENGNKLSNLTDDKIQSRNGKIGTIGNKTFIVSNNVQASECIVAVPKVGGDWLERVPLTTFYREEPGKDVLIRAWERGETKITDPKVFVRITGTNV